MSGYRTTLWTMQADGPSLNTSTTATSLIGTTNPKCTLPSNAWPAVGVEIVVRGSGHMSNIVTTPGTFTLDVRFGSTVVINGAAMQLSATAHTTLPFNFELTGLLRTIGAGTGGTLFPGGWAISDCLNPNPASLPSEVSPPVVGTGFDTSTTQAVDLFGTFSISNANNLFVLHKLSVDLLNWYP